VQEHGDYIMSEILANELTLQGEPLEAPVASQEMDLDGVAVTVTLKRMG
jgi:hypothetical protein